MCCFSGPVKVVADTKIFARVAGGTQFLAYEMTFDSEKPNAMILPLPVATPAKEDSVTFISLATNPNFFDRLYQLFPTISVVDSRGTRGFPKGMTAPKLVVHQVGDFVASFVPSMKDFSRLDKQFVIPETTWNKIPGYQDYGFAVFQLKELKGKTHPMAFRFITRWSNRIYFPTVHIHDGKVHSREMFDHLLYAQSAEYDAAVGKYRSPDHADPATGFVRSRFTAENTCISEQCQGLVDTDLLVHRMKLKGEFPNRDIIKPVSAGKTKRTQFHHAPMRHWALAPGVFSLSWLINRRNLLKVKGK